MDEVTTDNIVVPSAGVHIILPNYYAPASMGLIDPSTSDGRVIFFLQWQGNTIAGTTGRLYLIVLEMNTINTLYTVRFTDGCYR
jgi:glycerol-3-phosphate dehydrogenase